MSGFKNSFEQILRKDDGFYAPQMFAEGVGGGDGLIDLQAFVACKEHCQEDGKSMRVPAGDYHIGGYVHDLPVDLVCAGPGLVTFRPTRDNQKVIDIRESVNIRSTNNFRSKIVVMGGWTIDGAGYTGILGERWWKNTQLHVERRAVLNCDLGVLMEGTQYSRFEAANIEQCKVCWWLVDDFTGTLRVDTQGRALDEDGNLCSVSNKPQKRDYAGGGINNVFDTQTGYNTSTGQGAGIIIGRPDMPYPLGCNEFINLRMQSIATVPFGVIGIQPTSNDGAVSVARNRVSMYSPEVCCYDPSPDFTFSPSTLIKHVGNGVEGDQAHLPISDVTYKRSLFHSMGAATDLVCADLVSYNAPAYADNNSYLKLSGGIGGGFPRVFADDTSVVHVEGAAPGHEAYFENCEFGPSLFLKGYALNTAVGPAETVIDHSFPNSAPNGKNPIYVYTGNGAAADTTEVDPELGSMLKLPFSDVVGDIASNRFILQFLPNGGLAPGDAVVLSLLLRASKDMLLAYDMFQSVLVSPSPTANVQYPSGGIPLKAGKLTRLFLKNRNTSGYSRNEGAALWPATAVPGGVDLHLGWLVSIINPTAKQMSQLVQMHRFNPKTPPVFPGA